MEFPFEYYGHSLSPAPQAKVPRPRLEGRHPAPEPRANPFGFGLPFSPFLGRFRSSKRAILVKYAGIDRITASRHFSGGHFSREITCSRAFFGSTGASNMGAGGK